VAGKPGAVHSKTRTNSQRDAVRVGIIEKLLDEQADGDRELTAAQLKAIEIRYARLRPTLAAVEQHNIDDRDKLTDEAIVAALEGHVSSNPLIVDKIVEIGLKLDASSCRARLLALLDATMPPPKPVAEGEHASH